MYSKSRFTRRILIFAGAGFATRMARGRELLQVRNRDEQLSLAAPDFHFLTGRPLDRLHDGHTLGFEFQFAVSTLRRGPVLKRCVERFIVSYDLWEEMFVVARARRGLRPVSHLSAQAAEGWCLDHVPLSTIGIPADIPLWLRLDIRAEDVSGIQSGSDGEQGFDLTALIDIFSRPGRDGQSKWSLEAGPLTLGRIPKEEYRR